ncbi:helix-turn-helix domain-containing protein [Mesorhizobium sp.]|uniref:helix-turn-helix domain-containing protein n=1 Tax=Mesorhizobium sp. TaxID=1871066 RepID=UPI000FE45389|nr:helix-turn-helix domain-containing protein [Mesorhizobium sp.]RWE92366.1 MAG: helix-turn-helix domain-containing protein [Mesorhizobium sp.]
MGSQRIINEEDKLSLLQRMEAGENISELAREAGISRQRLYDWRDRLRLTGSLKARRRGRPGKASVVSSEPLQQSGEMALPPEEKALAKTRRRISELEQKVGQQQLDLDFFQEALRRIRDDHRQDTAPGGTESSRSSKK